MKKRILKNILMTFLLGILLGTLLIILELNGIEISFTYPTIIIMFAFVYIIIFVFLILKSYLRQKHIVSILNDKVDPDLFLKEIQIEIDKTTNKKQKKLLLVNKSAGLYYKGKFHYMINLLDSIDPSELNKNFKASYYNNFVLAYLAVDRIDDSINIMETYSEILVPSYKYESLNIAIKSTKALLDFHQGKISESKKVLDELVKENIPNNIRASAYFHLGQINLMEGNTDLGVNMLKEADALGKNTFIHEKVKELI